MISIIENFLKSMNFFSCIDFPFEMGHFSPRNSQDKLLLSYRCCFFWYISSTSDEFLKSRKRKKWRVFPLASFNLNFDNSMIKIEFYWYKNPAIFCITTHCIFHNKNLKGKFSIIIAIKNHLKLMFALISSNVPSPLEHDEKYFIICLEPYVRKEHKHFKEVNV